MNELGSQINEKDPERNAGEAGWQSTTLGEGDLLAQENVDAVLTAKMSIINDVSGLGLLLSFN